MFIIIIDMDTFEIWNVPTVQFMFMFMHNTSKQVYGIPYYLCICRCRRLSCTIPPSPFLKPFIKLYCGLMYVSMWLNRKFIVASVWYQNFNCFFFAFHEHFWYGFVFLVSLPFSLLPVHFFVACHGKVKFCKSRSTVRFSSRVFSLRAPSYTSGSRWTAQYLRMLEKKVNWIFFERAEFVKWICFAGVFFPLWQEHA